MAQAATAGPLAVGLAAAPAPQARLELATFLCDITPPVGHPLLGGLIAPAQKITGPLEARGVAIFGQEAPIVIAALDWCELRGAAYDSWRKRLAQAVGTQPQRVLVHCTHVHDAPYADLEAQRLLDERGLKGVMFDRAFFDSAADRAAESLRLAWAHRKPLTHVSLGQARVEDVASNRRVELNDGTVKFSRGSTTLDDPVRNAPVGLIDPFVKTLGFWDGDRPLAALNCYATHPMSRYGRGEVSADFIGDARSARQKDQPATFQVYLTGCAGDLTGGKFNDPADPATSRRRLAARLCDGMRRAWEDSRRSSLTDVGFQCVPLRLPVRREAEYSADRLHGTLADPKATVRQRIFAAMSLSWRQRVEADQPIDVPVVAMGNARIMLLPAEAFVGFQLAAQQSRPDLFVMTPAYGECAPGYIPTSDAREGGFMNEDPAYVWTAPESAPRCS